MKQFYVMIPQRLKDYGFVEREYGYEYSSHKATAIFVDFNDYRMSFMSATKDCIALVCEMYKDGIIEILDDNIEPHYVMKVSKEEMNSILKQRKENAKK